MRGIVLALCIGCSVLALASEPVAYVNGEPVTREELDRATALGEILFAVSQQFPTFAHSLLLTEEGKAFLSRYERDVLEKLVLGKIQLQEARVRGLPVDEAEIERKTKATLKQIFLYYRMSESEYAAYLLSQGDSLDRLRDDIARQHREKLLIAALKAALVAEIAVSEDEISAYYDEDPERFVDEGGKPLPYNAVRDRIAALLRQEKGEAVWQAWLSQARAQAQVEIKL